MQARPRELPLRIVLALLGAAVVVTGVNVGFGGITTLGLQGPTEFISVTDPDAFRNQDSHVRFLGGVWLGLGLLFLAGAVRLNALRVAVGAALLLVLIGGLSRLSGGQLDVLTGPGVGPSLAAELLLAPVLLWRTWSGRVSA
jgi:hypothetical protein